MSIPIRRDCSYEPLSETNTTEGLHTQVDCEETPQQSGLHTYAPESGRVRRSPIPDLDLFFSRIYSYHQKHGFTCMMLQEVFELGQFVFVVSFSTFLVHCVDYPVLFHDKITNSTQPSHKLTVWDVLYPTEQCVSNFGLITVSCLLVAGIFWALRLIKVLYHLTHFWDIKSFFNDTLQIQDSQLDNLTWHEVQARVRHAQRDDPITIYKQDLSELDIYHRILRFKNYMVAMVNKGLLPVRIRIPILGDVVFLTHGLKYNLEMILFWGPWSPFQDNWHVKDDFKHSNKRKELAAALSKHILWISLANLALCPLILLWQILYAFFNYADIIKREPGSLGTRHWSPYARLYLRHFNELDHELNARLNRAYRPATKYMNIFTSPLKTVFAKNIGFLSGAVLAVLIILTVYDEDVLSVEHVLTTITVLGSVVAACRVFIPDEHLVWCPENLLTEVLAHVHYLPHSWRGAAHTDRVMSEFSTLFQYRVVYLLQELLSPIVTPFMLLWQVRPRTLDIVDFYRNFTVTVEVGDVCSFAQMDVRRHGHPDWHDELPVEPVQQKPVSVVPALIAPAEDGKTELSLLHFTLTNPRWQMPGEAEHFVRNLRQNAIHELEQVQGGFPSLSTGSSHIGTTPYTGLMTSMINQHHAVVGSVRGGLSKAEGPLQHGNESLHAQVGVSMGASVFGTGSMIGNDELVPLEYTAADMSISTLYLHALHEQKVKRRGRRIPGPAGPHSEVGGSRLAESTPLLADKR